MTQNGVSAPTTGQNGTFPRPPQDLVNSNMAATGINVSPSVPTALDVRIRDRYVRYANDPATGIWRTGGDGIREPVSPFALTRIEIGRGAAAEIGAIHPRTGNVWTFEGSLDDVATGLWRAGRALGCRAERKTVYWALYEFAGAARRQQAARGAI